MRLFVGVIILNLLILVSAGPRSPCPDILSFVKDNTGSFYGLIKIRQLPISENDIKVMHLQVKLTNYDKDIPEVCKNN